MIKVENLYKSFKGVSVLQNISVDFYQDTVNLIIGSSGSGKTVLLKCLLGLFNPEKGNVYYNGEKYSDLKSSKKLELWQEIGVVFQGSALFDSMTVEENVAFPMKLFSNESKSFIQNRVDFVLERVGMNGSNKKKPNEISGGMKKRVAIARAIVMKPKFLFCDEPNSGLDPQFGTMIDQLLMEITKEYNMITVINTHDMNSVMEIGENIIMIDKCKKAWQGNKEEILKVRDETVEEFVYNTSVLKKFREQSLQKG